MGMERAWRTAPLVGLLLVLALAGSGCTPTRPGAGAGTPASNHGVVRVGAALSLTGSARLIGMAQRSGIKLAQDEINASQLLGGTRLDVLIEDDGSERDQAAAVFQRLIENKHVVALMGPTLSDSALSVDPMAQQAGVPVLAISNSANGITQIGNFIFRDNLSESQLTPQVISALRTRLKLHSAALLYSDTDPNRSGSHGFKAALQAMGVRITSEQTFAADQTDFSSAIEDIVASRPDALFVTAPSSAAAAILVQARRGGLDKIPIVGSNGFNSDAVVRSAGDAAEGLIVGSGWSLSNPSARNQQFIQAYHARYGVDPDQVAAQAYTGVYLLANAVQAARTSSDPRAVRDALEQTHRLDTPLGAFSFNASRDPDYPASVQIVHLGRFQPF
jgi:branched-chain amino acid transport system substrate-binding protein